MRLDEEFSPEEIAEALHRDMMERGRVQGLTNEQLVNEILARMPFTELDALLEEACTRLDPEWVGREMTGPSAPADESVLARCRDLFRKRVAQLLGKRG